MANVRIGSYLWHATEKGHPKNRVCIELNSDGSYLFKLRIN
jgi:hypothetical protein